MDDSLREDMERIRRTVTNEIAQLEDDFDMTRRMRTAIVGKLMDDVQKVSIFTQDNKLSEDSDAGMKVITTALKALSDIEKSAATAVGVKLRNRELDMASSADAKNRIAALLLSVSPKQIQGSFPTESLETHLAELFDAGIKESELRTDSRNLDE